MATRTQAVLAEALRLDVKERAHVATELLSSLDGPSDPDAEQAWAVEIERRVADLESGAAHLESWDEVKHRIERTNEIIVVAVAHLRRRPDYWRDRR